MMSTRTLSICVGISAYVETVLEPGEAPLRFLAKSAQTLSGLFSAMWPDGSSKHLVATDADATLAKVTALLAGETDEYDLCIVYLAGHGRGGGSAPFQFLFFGDFPTQAIASATSIDALMALPKATNLLLLLDCCHAGAYVEEGAYFRSEKTAQIQLCLASAKRDQSSWEDAHFQLSLFAHAVGSALTKWPSYSTNVKRVAEEFFRDVARDVSQHAFALKGSSAQEPIIAGAVDAVVLLPTATSNAIGVRSMSLHKVLVYRTRQILTAILCVAAVAVLAFSYATWRPAINERGYVEIRQGPQWLSFLNVGPWRKRVETNVITADLRTDDTDLLATLRDEDGEYLWPGVNVEGVRRWADIFISSFLDEKTAARWRVRLGYKNALIPLIKHSVHGGLGLRIPLLGLQVVTLSTATRLAAEYRILDPAPKLPNVWRVQWRAYVIPVGCGPKSPPRDTVSRIDTYLDSVPPNDYISWLRGLSLTAQLDPRIGFKQIESIITMLAAVHTQWEKEYDAALGGENLPAAIAKRFPARPTRAEVAALAQVALAVMARRRATGHSRITGTERAQLAGLMNGCGDVAAPILAALGKYGFPDRVVAWAMRRRNFYQGRLLLLDLAESHALPPTAIERVLGQEPFSGSPADQEMAFDDVREWLVDISDVSPLPPAIIGKLLHFAQVRANANDTDTASQALTLVLRNPKGSYHVYQRELDKLLLTLEQRANHLPPTDRQLELLGLLARSGGSLTIDQRRLLTSVLNGGTAANPQRVTFTDGIECGGTSTTELVAGPTFTNLVAFSRLVIASRGTSGAAADPRALPFLDHALTDAIRCGLSGNRLREVIGAAAAIREHRSANGYSAKAIHDVLEQFSRNAAARQARIDIAVAALCMASKARRNEEIVNLRHYWKVEREPELKLALAQIIIGAISEYEQWSKYVWFRSLASND